MIPVEFTPTQTSIILSKVTAAVDCNEVNYDDHHERLAESAVALMHLGKANLLFISAVKQRGKGNLVGITSALTLTLADCEVNVAVFIMEYYARVRCKSLNKSTTPEDKLIEIQALIDHLLKGNTMTWFEDRWEFLGKPPYFVESDFYR